MQRVKMITKTWGQGLEHEMLVSATDNCIGDTESRGVLVTSTAQATKLSPLPSAIHCAEDQKYTVAGLLWSKQERWRALLGSWLPAPATALLGRSARGKGRMNCAGLPLLWDLAEIHPTDCFYVCSPLSRGRSGFGAGQRVGGETFPDNLAAVLQP